MNLNMNMKMKFKMKINLKMKMNMNADMDMDTDRNRDTDTDRDRDVITRLLSHHQAKFEIGVRSRFGHYNGYTVSWSGTRESYFL